MRDCISENRLLPLIKYPGGKEKELCYILPALPQSIDNYYEPFVGGGAVYFSVNASNYYINDKSYELVALYTMVKDQNEEFFNKLNAIEYNWNIISTVVDDHEEEISNIYYEYKRGRLTEEQLGDRVTEFVLRNADEFNGLLTTDFNYRIEDFVIELCDSIKNKMIRMERIERQKGKLPHSDVVDNIEAALKAAFMIL